MRLKARRTPAEEEIPSSYDESGPDPAARLVTSVSTIKDTVGNVARFVDGNLAAGVDHLFVFLDGDQPEVRDHLAERPEVTVVTTDASYWGRRVPQNLNVRQIVNANLVNSLLAPFPWVAWLFHVDGDEVLHVEGPADGPRRRRARGPAAPPGGHRRHWDGEVDLFKRPLDKGTLCLLHQLGIITEPDNRAYYRGHVIGKCGLRPDNDLDMRIHDAWLPDGEPVPFLREDWLQLLHYETHSGDEFMRKWSKAPSATARVRTRARREQQTAAVRALFALPDVQPEVRERLVRELYDKSFRDDVDTLQEMGLLVRHTAASDHHTPVPLSDERREPLERWLDALLRIDKRFLRPRNEEFAKLDGLRALAEGLSDSELAEQVRASFEPSGVPAE